MKDARWTTKDKITLYKSIISQLKRDQALCKQEKMLQSKRNKGMVYNLKKSTDRDRELLANSMYADKQIVKHILALDPVYLNAYKELKPTDIVERLDQTNYNTRKQLDLVFYQQKVKTNRLIDLKLHASILEDRLKYKTYEKLPCEVLAAVITGKIQDMSLKREAALVVHHTYKTMLDIVSKDAIYMFKVIDALVDDIRDQGNCMYNTLIVGQLATEALSDKKMDFADLEATVKRHMNVREDDLKQTRKQVKHLKEGIKKVLRRDSDITMPFTMKNIADNSNRNELAVGSTNIRKIVSFQLVLYGVCIVIQ